MPNVRWQVKNSQMPFRTSSLYGLTLGAAAYFLLNESRLQIPIVIGAALVGALLGAWFSSMVGSALPNSRLKQFEPMIAEGKLLLMVDVPEHSVEEVKMRVGRDHPEAVSGGTDPHIPAFP